MCVILDANCYGAFLDPANEAMRPLRDWLKNRGKLVYAPTPKIKGELDRYAHMKARFVEYSKAGRLHEVDGKEVVAKEASLTGLLSDDAHIVALAVVAGVKVLVSHDKNLHHDFKKNIVTGKVYQNEKHKRLLKSDTCP